MSLRHHLLAAVLTLISLMGPACAPSANGAGTSSGGSLGVTRDDALLYAADSDLDTVFVIDARTQTVLRQVKVGRHPERLLVAPDGTVYVSNRGARSVSVLRPGEATEAARIPAGVEPMGLALSADARTLFIVNSTSLTDATVGTVQAVDTRTLATRWEAVVGPEPRAITLTGADRAVVTLLKEGEVVQLDVQKGAVARARAGLFEQLNRSALGLGQPLGNVSTPAPIDVRSGKGATVHPRGLGSIVASPDGQQVFVSATLASDATLDVRSGVTAGPGSGGSGYGGGSCGATAAASPAVLTLSADLTPQVEDLGRCTGTPGANAAVDRPPMLLLGPPGASTVQGPSALALDPTGAWLFIAQQSSNNVAVVPTVPRDDGANTTLGGAPPPAIFQPGLATVTELIDVGAGPTGLAVSQDGTHAWVFNAFDHSVTTLARVDGHVVATATTRLADDVLPPDVVAGRKAFFSAVDPRMDNPATGIACASCHTEAREDGHVWNFTDGPRQTPSLAGRHLLDTAPFHWSGEFDDFGAFMTHTTTRRMGGTGPDAVLQRQLAAYLASLEPADNPHRDTTPADVLARGQAVFERAQCGTCHGGPHLTDNGFADVGTLVTTGPVVDDLAFLPHRKLNTPSLLGLARTAPYLHDGSAPSLMARLRQGQATNQHGQTAQLTPQDLADLVAYLETL